MTGEWLAYCCGLLRCPRSQTFSSRASIDFHQITGMLEDDPVCWREMDAWMDAARVAHVMEHNRLAVMGHYYGGMLDIYSDMTRHCATFGGHIEIVEVDELAALRQDVTGQEIADPGRHFRQTFDVQADCTADRTGTGRANVGRARPLVERHRSGIAWPTTTWARGNAANEDAISSIILGNSLLTGARRPGCGRTRSRTAQAMKIMDAFGAGGSFTEYYAMDFADDVVLMGHDGPGHIAIAEGKTKVRPLEVYHGKVGRGFRWRCRSSMGRSRCCRWSSRRTGD